eukprot:scaffold107552_cov46-Prasinocladus_malaysianus.AAC.3
MICSLVSPVASCPAMRFRGSCMTSFSSLSCVTYGSATAFIEAVKPLPEPPCRLSPSSTTTILSKGLTFGAVWPSGAGTTPKAQANCVPFAAKVAFSYDM